MDEARLRQLVAELDALVPRDGALIREGPGFINDIDEPALIGNRRGYLRLGIELLHVGSVSPESPHAVVRDLRYMWDPADSVGEFAPFECRESLRPWEEESGRGFGETPWGQKTALERTVVVVLIALGSVLAVVWWLSPK
jgi:hypothetical protein